MALTVLEDFSVLCFDRDRKLAERRFTEFLIFPPEACSKFAPLFEHCHALVLDNEDH